MKFYVVLIKVPLLIHVGSVIMPCLKYCSTALMFQPNTRGQGPRSKQISKILYGQKTHERSENLKKKWPW